MSLATIAVPTAPPESASAGEILAWGVEQFGDRLAIGTAFQAEGMVLIDMAARLAGGNVRVFTIDTGRLPEATHEFMAAVRQRYGIAIEVVVPDAREVAAMVTSHGSNLFYDSVAKRRLCCQIRKVQPMQRKLAELDAYIVGLRRGQNESRSDVAKVQKDPEQPGVWKLSPLADWSEQQVQDYIRAHDVPRHPLYAEGYATIGCAPCSRDIRPGEHARDGRWWWEAGASKECGIHYSPEGLARRELDVLLQDVLQSSGIPHPR